MIDLMADVFISYSQRAKQYTAELASFIESQKLYDQIENSDTITVWYDREIRSGTSFRHEIVRELTCAKSVVVIWSHYALSSDWVYSEAGRAARAGTLIQVLADDLTADKLPPPFDVLHAVSNSDTEKILEAIRQCVTGARSPPPASLHPLWQGFWLLKSRLESLETNEIRKGPCCLLSAESGVVPFIDLQCNLQGLTSWAEDSNARIAGRLCFGAGGSGKTRLLIELCARRAAEGWLTGFVPEAKIGKGYEQYETKLYSLITDEKSKRRLLLVVDYAEGRQEDVGWLSEALIERRKKGGAPARLVLLARTAGEWWRDLFAERRALQDVFGKAGQSYGNTQDLSISLTQAQRMFLLVRTIRAFRAALAAAGMPHKTTAGDASRFEKICTDPSYSRPLAIQIEALLYHLSDEPTDSPVGLPAILPILVGIERRYWSTKLRLDGQLQRIGEIHKAIGQVTLVGGIPKRIHARDLFRRAQNPNVDQIFDDLEMLVGGRDHSLLPIQPDLVGEHHVARVIDRTQDNEMVDACFKWAETQQNDGEKRRTIITVLNRASGSDHGGAAGAAFDRLRKLVADSGLEFVDDFLTVAMTGEGKLLDAIQEVYPEVTKADVELVRTIAAGHITDKSTISETHRRIVRRMSRRQGDTLAYRELNDIARSASVHLAACLRLTKCGRWAEAYRRATIANRAYLRLAASSPDTYLEVTRAARDRLSTEFLRNKEYSPIAVKWAEETVDFIRRMGRTVS